ncbi:MAG: metallophosphoesterase [Planctomycetes bacterium]|nr:metallophosphoesterase [Planctomycetota bacterium]
MSTVLRLALALAAVAWAVAHGFGARDFELVRPRLGIPEIVRPGESIRVELRDALPWDEGPAPRVRLLGPAPLELELLELERRGAVRTAVARLPEDLALGAYGIEVELHGRRHDHPKAVHVHARPDDFEDLTVVHLADLPTFLGDGRGDLLMRRIVEEVNLIAPDLVLISGDIAYVGSWDHFRAALEHFEAFDAPVVAGIGNHEYRGLAAFFTLFGPLHHVVDLDGWRIVTLDSGHGRDELTETQLAFLEAALSGSVGAPRQDADAAREELPAPVEGARVPLVQMHHPPFWTRKLHVHVDRLVELCALYGVPAVLTGHWHGDYVFDRSGTPRRDTPDFPGTKYVVTTAAGADLRPQTSDSELHHGYRLLRFHRRVLSDYTYDQDGDGVRHPCASIPVGQLTQWQYGPRTVAVKNELHEDLRRARVRLWIDEENAGLVPDVGTLEEVLLEGGRTRYTVRVDVPRESEVQVTLVEGER